MRYDDASQTGSTEHSQPVARPDEDRLPAGSFGPATGNAITGAGTTSGAAGEDHVGAGATITAVQGAGGQTVATNGAYQASGQFGLLSMDMQGNFSYVRNPGTPDGVKDVFNYTVADASGANSSTTLTIDIGQVAAAAAGQGIVNLPQGVELSDIHVNGRDLVINMPDGTQMVIPGGAVFVPQLVIGDVQVPPTNLAALLVDNEPQPAAGPPLSSGGNFADPVPPLDPGVPLGDLIPPTELTYTPPEFRDIGQFEDTKPTVVIEPHDLAPGAVDALDQVNEAGLPAPRDGNVANETPGSGEIADGIGDNNSNDSENTFGQIVFTAGDGLQSITVDGVAITGASVGTTIQGQFGIMTITSVNLSAGTIGYTYTLTDNTSGDNTADHFTVIVTDHDGDTATATLTVDIIDDVPTAHNDTDAIVGNDQSTDGNVMTGVGTTSGAAGADVVGADNATVTGAHPGSAAGSFTAVPQDGSGVTIHGTFGDLVLHDDGTYTYTRSDVHQGGTDVFTYQLTDGDGDTSTATLTITVPQVNQPPEVAGATTNVSEEGLVGGNPDTTGSPDTTNSPTASGSIGATDADGDSLTIAMTAPSGNYFSGGDPVTWAVSDNGHTLTGSAGGNTVITVTLDNTGHYEVTLSGPFDDANTSAEDSISFTVPVTVSDGIDTTPSTLVVTVEDDSPVVNPTVNADATVTLDETGPAAAAAINTGSVVKGDDPDVSGTGAISTATSGTAIVDAHVAFGGDGPAATDSLTYALSITNASSGLTTTDGSAINLVMQNGVIVGVVSGGPFDGKAAFAISIDSTTGVVTVEQYLSLDHPVTTDPNDALHMLTGSIGVTVTAVDGDGDHTTSGAVDISQQITFLDDGPAAHPDTNSVNEGGTVTGNVETNDLFGADGKDTGGGVTGVEAGSHPTDVVTTGVGSPIAGTWGTLTLNADGSYTYHANANSNPPPGSTDVFTYTITDGDGDTSTTTLTITVSDVTASVGSATTIVSEEVLPVVGTERNGDTDSDPTHDVLVNSGNITLTDSLGGATFTTALTAPSGTYTSGGTTIVWTSSNGGHTMTGTAGGNTVIVATIDNTGHYTVTLSGPIDTPNGVNAGENGGDSIIVFGVTATDNLGNTLTPGTLTVHVEDDAPIIDVTKGTDSVSLTTDDADTIGSNTDHATSTANFGGVFGLTFEAGADGTNTTPTLQYTLGVSSSGVDSGLDSHGSSIFLYVIGGVVVGSTATSIGAVTAGNTIFDVSVNSSGQVTLDQFQQIDHPIGSDPTPTGTPFSDQSISMADGLITLTATASITDKDGDTATDHETVNIGANLHFTDDGPHAATSGTAVGTVTLDETRPEGTDTTGGAAPSGDASATIDFSTNFVTGGSVNYGADGPGSVTYSLSLNGTNVNSGLYALDNTDTSTADGDGYGQGGQIVLNQSGNTITGSFNGVNYFTITINPTTGVATFTELHNIWNPVAGSSAAALDDLATLSTALATDIKVVQTVTDFDGDTSTASINVGQNVFGIEDDGPRFGTVDTTLQIDNTGTISGTGDMQITIGTDSPNGGSGNQNPDDLSVSNFTIDVNGSPATNVVLTPGAENATTASYTFSFQYDTGTGGLDTETGTLVFDKAAGTYTVTLDHPISGFSILDTAGAPASAFINYNSDGTVSSGPSDIATVQLSSDIFLQFTGVADKSGSDHLTTTVAPGGTFTAQSGVAFSGLELFSQAAATVTVSSSAAGVAGNTIQGGEVLDFNLYNTDPHGTTGGVPTASASSMFIELDGVGGSEDMIVVLKLLDTSTGKYSEVALMVQNGDIITSNATLAGTAYSGIVLDNNDGLIVIEPNDYQQGNTNLVIVGAQIAGSDDGITGTAINFNGALGTSGGSSGTQAFSTDVSDQPFKIQNIGFITENTQDQNATISFDTTIHDADGDTATTSVTVNIGDTSQNVATTLSTTQTTQMVSQTSLNTSSLISSNDNTEQRTSNTAHNTALMGAVAAAGLDSLHGLQSDHASVSGIEHSSALTATNEALVASASSAGSSHADSAHSVQPTLTAGATTHSAPQGGGTVHDMVESAHSLTPANAQPAAPTDLPHGTEGPAHAAAAASAVTAAAVVMPSAAQLAAAASHGVAQVDNSVAGNTAQHEQVVSKVLVDALHGGGGGANIDGLLNNVSSHGAPQDVLQALASHAAGAVSFGHTAFADAFGTAHGMQLMHPDVAPPVHG